MPNFRTALRSILPRFIIAAIFIGGFFYVERFLLVNKAAIDEEIVAANLQAASNNEQALSAMAKSFVELPSPGEIQPGVKDSAQQQLSALNNSYSKYKNMSLYPDLRPADNASSPQATNYNKLLEVAEFTTAQEQANSALRTNLAFLEHHYEVMKALRNILQYQPSVDLASDSPAQRLFDAASGFGVTLDRLNAAPEYSDASLEQIITRITDADKVRSELELIYEGETQPSENDKEHYVRIILELQTYIISNRANYWDTESSNLLKITQDVLEIYRPYIPKLFGLIFSPEKALFGSTAPPITMT